MVLTEQQQAALKRDVEVAGWHVFGVQVQVQVSDLRTETRCVPDAACAYVVELGVPGYAELVPMTARLIPLGGWKIAPPLPDG